QMGSKRRHDEEDEVSLKKRRKRNDSNEDIATTLNTPTKKNQASNGHGKSGPANGEASFVLNDEEDERVVYLIRKPKSLSIEDLEEKVKLKSKVKSRTKIMELDSGANYTMTIAANDSVMYHVPATNGQFLSGSHIAGTVTITQNETKNEEGDFIMHNDPLEDPPTEVEMPFVIAPIKRKAVLVLDGLKQRLHAYGCLPTEEERAAKEEEIARKVKKAKRKSKRRDEEDE
ncbi:hypothetical protein PFISCL1PPCAC_26251, partial [Pristionchus fissidentatus]